MRAAILKDVISTVCRTDAWLDRPVTSSDQEVVRDRSSDLGVRPYIASRWAGAGIVPFGDEVLHQATQPLEIISDDVIAIAGYMIEVMHARHGIGLAANQVGLPLRMFVHNLPKVAPQVIINPVVTDLADEWSYTEGCLSMTLEGTRGRAMRPRRVLVEALDISGAELRISADELLARVFLHEIDHLDGLVFAQRLAGVERDRVYSAMARGGFDTSMLPQVWYEDNLSHDS